MSTFPTAATKTSILFDLKPALDGFAGIPQETRLLFRGLRSLDGCDVVGLIQHGARRLRSGPRSTRTKLTISKRIDRSSRVVLSLSGVLGLTAKEKVKEFLLMRLGQFAGPLGLRVTPGSFEAALFDDFIWTTFFSKTLKSLDRSLVTSGRFQVLRPSRKRMHQVGLSGRRWSSTPRYLNVGTHGYDVLVAQTPFPGRVSAGTKLVVRYHDAVPVLMPHTIGDTVFHQASHYYALQENVRAGAWFSCVSESTRCDLLKMFPEVESRTSVIHNIASDEYFDEPSSPGLVRQIIRNRLSKTPDFVKAYGANEAPLAHALGGDFQYLLMVSTIEPRKNHLLLTAAWERLRYGAMPGLKLVIVGNPGWAHERVFAAFIPWAERGQLWYLNDVPSAELRVLYRHAAATICPSLAEGFDYSGIEAMRCGGAVISSDIPVHREIFGEASIYFDPYSAEDAAAVIGTMLAEVGQPSRERLRRAGAQVSSRYSANNILPQWEAFIREIKNH